MTEDVAASDGDRIPRTIVTFKADVAAGVGVEYEHDRRRTRPARAREARGGEREGGIIRLAGTDRLAHIACRLDHVQAGRKEHVRHPSRGAGIGISVAAEAVVWIEITVGHPAWDIVTDRMGRYRNCASWEYGVRGCGQLQSIRDGP